MKEDWFDIEIKKAFNEKINKPKEYIEVIKNVFNKHKRANIYMRMRTMKKVACVLFIFILTASVVFAKDISTMVNKFLLKTNSSEGVREAIDNGYIDEIDTEKTTSNGIEISVKEVLMDDFNLLLLFDLEMPELDNVELIRYVQFENFVITDEEDNVIALTLEGPEKYEEFYNERNIQTRTKNIAYNNGSYCGEIIKKSKTNIEYKYSTTSERFPKCKKLNISFDKVIINKEKSANNIIVEGNWNINVDLATDMHNRETILYEVKECSEGDIKVTKAEVSKTEMKFEMVTKWGNPVYSENDTEEDKKRKKEEFFNNAHSTQNILINNEYVENDRGEKFFPVINSSDGNMGYNQMFNGNLRYWQTFNFTQYNMTDIIYVIFEKQGKKINIVLQRKN